VVFDRSTLSPVALAITGALLLGCVEELPKEAGGASELPEASAASPADADLERLADWLTGSFSSAAQSKLDPDFLDIRIRAVRIWRGRDDGAWVYLEQAAADSLERPYRQRVYHVTRVSEDLFQSRVHALEDPLTHAGRWREEEPLAELAPESLLIREGCAVLLRLVNGPAYSGSTLGRLCSSELRGARYATSEVEVRAHGLISWDRGYDEAGTQVWGAEKGPYVFDRIDPGTRE
jgi:hypothetical protein